MQEYEWGDIRHFLEVVRCGSLGAAAERLGCNASTVSRRIAGLERQLGTPLFDRSNGGWAITAAGEKILAIAERMAEQADAINRFALAESVELRGTLTVTAGDPLLRAILLPALAAFTCAHPEIQLQMIADDERIDLGTREADIAVRCTAEPPPNLVGRKIANAAMRVYGTADLIAAALADPQARDIPVLTWLGDGATRPEWLARTFPNTERLYRVNALGLMLDAARAGMGLAMLPCMLCDRAHDLLPFPMNQIQAGWGVWVLSHVDVRTSARVRALRDALVDALTAQTTLIEGKVGLRAE